MGGPVGPPSTVDVGLEAFQQNDAVELVELVTGQRIAGHRGELDAFAGPAIVNVGAVAAGGGNAVDADAVRPR